jgi:hypothetical protein
MLGHGNYHEIITLLKYIKSTVVNEFQINAYISHYNFSCFPYLIAKLLSFHFSLEVKMQGVHVTVTLVMHVVSEGSVNRPEGIIYVYSVSVHTLLRMSRVIVATPVLTLRGNSLQSRSQMWGTRSILIRVTARSVLKKDPITIFLDKAQNISNFGLPGSMRDNCGCLVCTAKKSSPKFTHLRFSD